MTEGELIQALNISGEMAIEVKRARDMYPKFNSAHEGYAVLREEVDELWDEIKKKTHDPVKLREEAIQVGAMSIRFIMDIVDGQNASQK